MINIGKLAVIFPYCWNKPPGHIVNVKFSSPWMNTPLRDTKSSTFGLHSCISATEATHKSEDNHIPIMVLSRLVENYTGNGLLRVLLHGGIITWHYGDVIMGAIASQIISLTIDYSTVHSDADQRKHQSSASLAFVRRIHLNSPHKWLVTRKMFPFDDVISWKSFLHYWPFVKEVPWWPVDSITKCQ